MKNQFDLFGQMVISKFELYLLKRKFPTISYDVLIIRTIKYRLGGQRHSSREYVSRTAKWEPLKEMTVHDIKKYLSLCQSNTEYRKFIESIRHDIKIERARAEAQKLKSNQFNEAQLILLQLTHSNRFEEKQLKKKNPSYEPEQKILSVHQLELILEAGIDTRLIPWECASDKCVELGQKLGIYRDPSIPPWCR
ncbi:hypothetical protein [Hydromonas duriensis]|nr:hypothetical protein [Hydromonas duriensis]